MPPTLCCHPRLTLPNAPRCRQARQEAGTVHLPAVGLQHRPADGHPHLAQLPRRVHQLPLRLCRRLLRPPLHQHHQVGARAQPCWHARSLVFWEPGCQLPAWGGDWDGGGRRWERDRGVREGPAGSADARDPRLRRPKFLSPPGVICSTLSLFAVHHRGTRVHRGSRRAKATCTATPRHRHRHHVAPTNTHPLAQGFCPTLPLAGPSNPAR